MFKISATHASRTVDSLQDAMRLANRLHEVGRPVIVTDLTTGEIVIAWGQRIW